MTIKILKQEITTGIELHLNNDELGNLRVALSDYKKLMHKHGNLKGGTSWPWIDDLLDKLNQVER